MNKFRYHILPDAVYSIKVGDHEEDILGIDILAILEAAFDEMLLFDEALNEDPRDDLLSIDEVF